MKFLIFLFGYLILGLLSYVIPKKKGMAVFVDSFTKRSYSKFTGNHKSLYLYMLNKPSELKPYWLTGDKNIFSLLSSQKYPVLLFNKITLFWFILRAELLILVSHGPQMPWGKFKFVQLWHGAGFKDIVKDKHNYFLNKSSEKLSFIIASSDADQKRKIDCFGNQRVIITGFPRNDIFFRNDLNADNYKNTIGIKPERHIILYAPTFRQKTQKYTLPFSYSFHSKLCDFLKKRNMVFLIKRHPLDNSLKFNDNCEYIRDVTSYIEDVQELLAVTDIMISDYSGIVSDFVLTGKPILYYLYDYDDYIKSKSFYYDVREATPGPFIYNENDLLEYLVDMAWFDDSNYRLKYQEFVDRFHLFKDGNSSARVLEQILKMRN